MNGALGAARASWERVGLVALLGACRQVFQAHAYRYVALGLFLLAVAFYFLTLPSTFTGGVIGLVALQYLNAELVFFSLTLATALSLALTLNLYGVRRSPRRHSSGLSLGAILTSLVPSSLCCTSLVPSLLAALGASTPQIFGLTGRIQGAVAKYEMVFLAVALFLVLISLRLAVFNLMGSCSLPERRLASDGPDV